MFGFSALSEAPFSALPVTGGQVLYVNVDEAVNCSSVESSVVTFVAARAEALNVSEVFAAQVVFDGQIDEDAQFDAVTTSGLYLRIVLSL